MPTLIRLGDAAGLVGSARSFTAVIQQITRDRRRVLRAPGGGASGPSERIATYHVLHVADPTTTFFKLVCWGPTPPSLAREDHDGEDLALAVGDMVLFSECQLRAFRGNVEGQFTRHSRVQLLYRRDRYFNTRDVRLKDFYPMIEWYKAHRHEFLLLGGHAADSPSPTATSNTAAAVTSTAAGDITRVRDLREDAVVNLRGIVTSSDAATTAAATTTTATATAAEREAADTEGTLLHEIVLRELVGGDTVGLNLWDHFADPRFVARLRGHQGPIEIRGAVVTLNCVSRRLLVNTTPRTVFEFLDTATAASATVPATGDVPISADDDNNYSHSSPNGNSDRSSVQGPNVYSSIDALDGSAGHGVPASAPRQKVVLENVHVEQVHLAHPAGATGVLEPSYTSLLVECICRACEQTLPAVDPQTIPVLYGSCENRCRVKQKDNLGRPRTDRLWRYKPLRLILRDHHGARLEVIASDAVVQELVGNIPASLLIHPHDPDHGQRTPLAFNVRYSVAKVVNALVEGGVGGGSALRADLELLGFTSDCRDRSLNASISINDDSVPPSQDPVNGGSRRIYALVSLTPTAPTIW